MRGRTQRRHREALPGAQQRGAAQTVLGQHEEDDEEEDHRERDAEVRGPRPGVREVTEHVGTGQAENQRSGEGQPNAAKPSEHGGSDGIEHEQRQDVHVERAAADRGDEDPRQGRQRGAQRPREHRQPLRTTSVQLEQRLIVHHRPHGHTRPCALEEQPDADRNEYPATQGDRLVVGDIDAEDLELRGVAEEQLIRPGDAGVPDPRSQGDQPEHDPDGDDDLGHLGRLAQPPHDAAVEDGPGQWGQDHDHDEQGERGRPVPAVAELPIGEGGEHGHRPLGEVEDARSGVGQDQPRGGDPVDRAGDQAENGVLEKEVHGRSSRPLRSPDGRSGAASAHP